MHKMGIGPEVKSDDPFRRRLRRHQGWYRDRVLQVPYGTGPQPGDDRPLGNMLAREAAEAGLNFLNREIFELARKRIENKTGTVDAFRLLRNMLSSQPMCFNLFGGLALDLDVATGLARALWGRHIDRVRRVCFEWAPEPAKDYLADRTAFDAFIEYEMPGGDVGFIGIETKLSEPFSRVVYEGSGYRRWMTGNHPWRPGAHVAALPHNQLWRGHLLAWSMLKRCRPRYARGEFAVVFHPQDERCRKTIAGYRDLLLDDATFSSFDLSEIAAAWAPLAGPWLQEFERRYLALDLSSGRNT